MNFDSSFYGKDRLRIRFQAGNVPKFASGTDSTRLSFDANNGNDIVITDVYYRFTLSDRIRAHIGPKGLDLDDVFSVTNPILKSDSAGAITRFGRRNALLFFGTEGSGASTNKVKRKELVNEYLNRVGLYNRRDSFPHQLSGGMKQRASIVRALINSPSVLLMDEPFSALDAQTRHMMQELLMEIWQDFKTTVVFVTHDIEEAVLLGDRILVMGVNPGHVKEDIAIDLKRPLVVRFWQLYARKL